MGYSAWLANTQDWLIRNGPPVRTIMYYQDSTGTTFEALSPVYSTHFKHCTHGECCDTHDTVSNAFMLKAIQDLCSKSIAILS